MADKSVDREKYLTRKMRNVIQNIRRFPDDFILVFTNEEDKNLRPQIAISSWAGPETK